MRGFVSNAPTPLCPFLVPAVISVPASCGSADDTDADGNAGVDVDCNSVSSILQTTMYKNWSGLLKN